MREALAVAVAGAIVAGVAAVVVIGWPRLSGSGVTRLQRYKEGRPVTVPLGVEFRHDGAELPKALPRVMAASARVRCSTGRGVITVKGARMVPGFDDGFWPLLAAQWEDGRLRCLKREEHLLLAVPMAHPPGSGILVRLGTEDLTILVDSLSRGRPGRPAPPGSP